MNYRLSTQIIGTKELEEAFRKAPDVTADALRRAVGKTAYTVERRAKGHAPVDKGNLRASITTDGPHVKGFNVESIVGTNVHYARFQEAGTGVFGPNRQPIKPVRARRLVFKRGGKWIFARQVQGVRPRWYFKQARSESTPDFTEHMREALTTIVSALAT